MRMRLIGFSCALALIALALVPMLPPSRALTNAPEKIDPALQTMMTARPLALLPVIVEMQPPTASVGNVDRANQALDLLRLNGAAAVGLPLLGSAAGFANAAGIDAMSLVPTVAYIHYDATVVPDVVVPDAASDRALDPPPTPPTPTASPTPTPTPTASPLTQGTTVYPQSVNADQVVASGTTGRGVTVAVLDSGVAADPDLTQPSNRILASVNFADTRTTSDPGGHGTHVAGIVAGNGTRSGGQFVGIAPQANI